VNPTNVTLKVVTPSASIADASIVEGNSGTTNEQFTVTLSESSAAPISVAYTTSDGTATAPADYTSTSGTLNFAPFQTMATISVPVVGDHLVESDETYSVTLGSPTNSTVGRATATGTITNDDFPADLSIGMTHAPEPVPAGSSFTYAITVTNNGTGIGYSPVVTAPVPTNATFVSADNGGTKSKAVVTWNLPDLAVSGTATVHMTVSVGTNQTGTVSDSSAVTSSITPDPNTANNSANDVANIVPSADLSMSITPSAGSFADGGSTVSYTLTVTNAGPSTATSVGVSASSGAGTAGGSSSGTFGGSATIAAGGTKSYTFTVTAGACYSGSIPVSASASSATADPNTANNTAQTTTPVTWPTGGRIVYSNTAGTGEHLMCVGTDGAIHALLFKTLGKTQSEAPMFSPSGTKIVFSSNMSGNFDIWTVNTDGSGVTDLTADSGAVDSQPAWSPDGSKIAFVSTRSGGGQLYTMNASNGSGVTAIGGTSGGGAPSWSPDGAKIAFQKTKNGHKEIFVGTVATGKANPFTTQTSGDAFGPAWSPNGSTIAYHLGGSTDFQIYLQSVSSTTPTQLTNNPGVNADPAWNPASTMIAFDYAANIYILATDHSSSAKLTTDGESVDPSWIGP
jgi:uncharacterized repeat protein (TIGR01451 family)